MADLKKLRNSGKKKASCQQWPYSQTLVQGGSEKLMNLKSINWKVLALVIGVILLLSIITNATNYYHYRHLNLSPIIPEWVMIQSAKPYLVATIASIVATITAWTFYYFSKFKITVGVGVAAFIFFYVNFYIIGESWAF